MFHFNKILFTLLFSLLLSDLAFAQEQQSVLRPARFRGVALSYISWTEMLTLDDGNSTADAFANFYGTGIGFDRENYRGNTGTIFTGAAIFGQANGGGTQTGITYQKAYQKWYGVKAEYKYAYRLSSQIVLGIGPSVLFRHIDWPKEGLSEVKSGSTIGLGLLGELRMRVTPRWEVQQTLGTLAFKASTIWTVGVGYKY